MQNGHNGSQRVTHVTCSHVACPSDPRDASPGPPADVTRGPVCVGCEMARVCVWCVWYVTVVVGRPPSTRVSVCMVVKTSGPPPPPPPWAAPSSDTSLQTLGGRELRLDARLLGRLPWLLPVNTTHVALHVYASCTQMQCVTLVPTQFEFTCSALPCLTCLLVICTATSRAQSTIGSLFQKYVHSSFYMKIVLNCIHIWSIDLFLIKDKVLGRKLIKIAAL